MPVDHPFSSAEVAAVFDAISPPLRTRLLELRALIFHTAAEIPAVGPLEESLRWGEPAYLTSKTKSGSTLRIGPVKRTTQQYALYFNCQTSLVDNFRTLFRDDFNFQGNRAIILDLAEPLVKDHLAFCIAAALTYHRKLPLAVRV
jgi:hypothetical protein